MNELLLLRTDYHKFLRHNFKSQESKILTPFLFSFFFFINYNWIAFWVTYFIFVQIYYIRFEASRWKNFLELQFLKSRSLFPSGNFAHANLPFKKIYLPKKNDTMNNSDVRRSNCISWRRKYVTLKNRRLWRRISIQFVIKFANQIM